MILIGETEIKETEAISRRIKKVVLANFGVIIKSDTIYYAFIILSP